METFTQDGTSKRLLWHWIPIRPAEKVILNVNIMGLNRNQINDEKINEKDKKKTETL